MKITTMATGCGDIVLSSISTASDDKGLPIIIDDPKGKRYPNTVEIAAWLDAYLKKGSCDHGQFVHKAFVVAILNEGQEKAYGHILRQNGFEALAEGVNANHNSVLTLYARVRRTERLRTWAASKAQWFSGWFKTPKEEKKEKQDAGISAGTLLQR